MPFVADTRCGRCGRCGIIRVELNVNWVVEMLEELTGKILNPEVDLKNPIITSYVKNIEIEYANMITYNDEKTSFSDWFDQNYDNVDADTWFELQDLLILEKD